MHRKPWVSRVQFVVAPAGAATETLMCCVTFILHAGVILTWHPQNASSATESEWPSRSNQDRSMVTARQDIHMASAGSVLDAGAGTHMLSSTRSTDSSHTGDTISGTAPSQNHIQRRGANVKRKPDTTLDIDEKLLMHGTASVPIESAALPKRDVKRSEESKMFTRIPPPEGDKINVVPWPSACNHFSDGKCAPAVIIAGAKKCGTNTIAAVLKQHPYAKFKGIQIWRVSCTVLCRSERAQSMHWSAINRAIHALSLSRDLSQTHELARTRTHTRTHTNIHTPTYILPHIYTNTHTLAHGVLSNTRTHTHTHQGSQCWHTKSSKQPVGHSLGRTGSWTAARTTHHRLTGRCECMFISSIQSWRARVCV